MGFIETSVEELLRLGGKVHSDCSYPGIPVEYKNRRGQKASAGELQIVEAKITETSSFLDYIAGGTELSLMVAVDFTMSNGDPFHPESLHYLDPSNKPNQYQAAMSNVGSILQEYDNDKRFPLWGFGGIPGLGDGFTTSHCFQLGESLEVNGVKGLVDEYNASFRCVSL